MPFDLEFAVTNKCNLRCIQCNVWKRYEERPWLSKNELSMERIGRIFSSYRKFRIVGITGGEPHLRSDLTDILGVITSTQTDLESLFITTNGQQPNVIARNVSRTLKRTTECEVTADLTHFVSIDGPHELHDWIRGVSGAHERALDTIRQLAKLANFYRSFRVGTVTVCSPFNIDRFGEVLDHVSRLKDEFEIEPSFCVWLEGQLYDNIGTHDGLSKAKFRDKLIKFIPRIKSVARTKSLTSIGRCIFYDLLCLWLKKPQKQVIPCGAAKVRYFLDPYGDVYPCTIFNHKAGRLKDQDDDFEKLLSSDSRSRTRNLVEQERCPICCNTCETIPAMMAKPMHTASKWLMSRLVRA